MQFRHCNHYDHEARKSLFKTVAQWRDCALRYWTETECKRCGVIRRNVNGKLATR